MTETGRMEVVPPPPPGWRGRGWVGRREGKAVPLRLAACERNPRLSLQSTSQGQMPLSLPAQTVPHPYLPSLPVSKYITLPFHTTNKWHTTSPAHTMSLK